MYLKYLKYRISTIIENGRLINIDMKEFENESFNLSSESSEIWADDNCSPTTNQTKPILAAITIASAVLTVPNVLGNMVSRLLIKKTVEGRPWSWRT